MYIYIYIHPTWDLKCRPYVYTVDLVIFAWSNFSRISNLGTFHEFANFHFSLAALL